MKRYCLVLVALAGCNEQPAIVDAQLSGDSAIDAPIDPPIDAMLPITTYQSGTRLRVSWIDFGGSLTTPRIHDNVRNEACAKQRWADGKDYCTPAFATALLFEDAQCTRPLVMATATAPTYVALPVATACGAREVDHLYRLGPPTQRTTYYQHIGLRCDGSSTRGLDVRVVATEVTTADLVELVTEVEPTSARLAATWLTSADGLRIDDGLRDTNLDVTCVFDAREVGATTARCLPPHPWKAGTIYSDDTCTSAATTDVTRCSTNLAVLRTTQPAACVLEPSRIFAVGGPTPLGYTYEIRPHGCAVHSTRYPERVLGAEQDAADVPRVIASSSSRIAPVVHRVGTHERHSDRLFDTAMATECTVTSANGEIRCLPPLLGRVRWEVYSDAACTRAVKLLELPRGAASCATPSPGRFVRDAVGDNYQVGGELVTAFYQANLGACVARPRDANTAYFEVIDVSPSVFARGALIVK